MRTIKTLEFITLAAIFLLVPVLVLPLFPNAYITPKLIVLAWGLTIVLALKAIRILISRNVRFSVGTFDVPVILLVLATILGLFMRGGNADALILPGLGSPVIP